MPPRSVFALSAIFGGFVWLLAPAIPDSALFTEAVAFDRLVAVTPLLLVVGLYGFYREYAAVYSRWSKIGTGLACVGLLGFVPISLHPIVGFTFVVGVVAIATAVAGGILSEAGTILLALDVWRTETPSKRLAVWFPLALPATVLANYVGSTQFEIFDVLWLYHTGVVGLAWIGLGYYLLATPGDGSLKAAQSGG